MAGVQLYNPHDGLTGRDGGPYLDEVERRSAETVRAAKEGRKPDYDNAPATAGTPLVTAGQLVNIANPASIPSQEAAEGDSADKRVSAIVRDKTNNLKAFGKRNETQAEKDAKKDDDVNPASPVVVGTDEDAGLGSPSK